MCDPLTIAGAALTVGANVANYAAQQSVMSARNDALATNRMRQNRLDQEADALNLQSRNRYVGFEDQQDQTKQTLADFIQQQTVEEPPTGTMMPASSSNMVVQEEENQRDKARGFTDESGEALANLRSFGDLLGGIGRNQARDATEIGQVGGFKQGWSNNVLPYELEAANEKGRGMRLLGDIMGGFGSVAMTSGLGGGSLGDIFGKSATAGAGAAASSIPMPRPRPSPGLRLSNLYGG